eukprot:TRINITY_DN2655_c0_g3_i1.p1 TRINITY_DN2655_c0_g3~~TRINITY_DN2655_c0_g3_i1.p1  ORF type:complete len:1296 (-),score=220.20 TRINITY_DN2655_c0_g3_i1:95-3982(-)
MNPFADPTEEVGERPYPGDHSTNGLAMDGDLYDHPLDSDNEHEHYGDFTRSDGGHGLDTHENDGGGVGGGVGDDGDGILGDEYDEEYDEDQIEPRLVHFNKPDFNSQQKFMDNYVSTTKYKFWNFLPKNLFEQFRRVANIYFLVIALITLTPISPVKPGAFILALVVVMGCTAIKEGLEDYRRYQSDKKINSRLCNVLRARTDEDYTKKHVGGSGEWEAMSWKEIRVGDLVMVKNWEPFPADLLLLSSGNANGQCYIETANLDGETNLKIRQALKETMDLQTTEGLSDLSGIVVCDPPNEDMYKFDGSLSFMVDEENVEVPLGTNQLLLRGSVLRNTNYIVGLVLYTGHQTKYMLSTTDPPSKRSRVEKLMNRLIVMVLILEIMLVTVSAILGGVWQEIEGRHMWYLDIKDHVAATAIFGFFTFLVLYSPMVPISLYVTMEFVRIGQAYFIENDREMYYEETNTRAQARTSNLNEELGQIDYVFSDKTGTLTCNEMVFRVCSVGGEIFGKIPDLTRQSSADSIERKGGVAPLPGNKPLMEYFYPRRLFALFFKKDRDRLQEEKKARELKRRHLEEDSGGIRTKDVEFDDDTIYDVLEDEAHESNKPLREFLTVLAVCHTVIPEEVKDELEYAEEDAADMPDVLKRTIRYQASSPDESALVAAAKHFGYFFHTRSHNTVTVNVMGRDEQYEVLNVMEFNSTRKRMSVIVRTPRGELKLYCKGADSIIYERLNPHRQAYSELTSQHLNQFACAGLRTLCVAKADLDPAYYEEWNARWKKAEVAMVNRKAKLAELAEEIEVNLDLVGATGIEDRLQDGVPDTIEQLLVAGIKVWVLTGDKRETALNVGKACNLLKDGMIVLQLITEDYAETKDKIEQLTKLVFTRDWRTLDEENALREMNGDQPTVCEGRTPQLALVVEGRTLIHALEDDLKLPLLRLAQMCHTVVACRTTPLQKTLMVRLVREYDAISGFKHETRDWFVPKKVTTLAIGDGANDVPMIQEAHVGIGISGKEGMQAVLASDYAIAQFRFLTQLLFIHGRYSYKRVSLLVLYFFYKNLLIAMINLWWSFFTGFSGQTIWDAYLGIGFNLVFTAFPIIIVAVLDQDVPPDALKQHPQLYRDGQQNITLNTPTFLRWIFAAVMSSIACFAIPAYAFNGVVFSNGQVDGLWDVNTVIYASTVFVCNLKLAIEINTWTYLHHATMWSSIGTWFLFSMAYMSDLLFWLAENQYWIIFRLVATPTFWLVLWITVCICLLPDLAYNYMTRNYMPENFEIVQEIYIKAKRREEKHMPFGKYLMHYIS